MQNRASIKQLVESYVAADRTEAEHRERMLALLAGGEDPWSRQSFRPGHFTASSFVLNPDGTHLLLILHRVLGLWLQPGGHFDPLDKDLDAATRREVSEETGVVDMERLSGFSGLFDVDIHRIPANPGRGEPGHEHFDLRLAFHARNSSIRASSDAADARWVRLEETPTAGTDESVERAVRKLISRKLFYARLL